MSIEIILKSASGKTVLMCTQEGRSMTTLGTIDGTNPVKGGRYAVDFGSKEVYPGFSSPDTAYFDDRYSAIQFFNFQVAHELFVSAKEAGLNDATAELVATRKMTLEEALGEMDTDEECLAMVDSHYNYEDENQDLNEYGCPNDPEEQDWEGQGGEDDNTPPLEVIMAGGQAAWDYQNEKNAWLDSRF